MSHSFWFISKSLPSSELCATPTAACSNVARKRFSLSRSTDSVDEGRSMTMQSNCSSTVRLRSRDVPSASVTSWPLRVNNAARRSPLSFATWSTRGFVQSGLGDVLPDSFLRTLNFLADDFYVHNSSINVVKAGYLWYWEQEGECSRSRSRRARRPHRAHRSCSRP